MAVACYEVWSILFRYSYVHESTEVAEDHYHEEFGIRLVHTEVGTNKKSIIWISNWKSQMDKDKRMGNVQISCEYLGSRLLKQWNLWNAMQIGDLSKKINQWQVSR